MHLPDTAYRLILLTIKKIANLTILLLLCCFFGCSNSNDPDLNDEFQKKLDSIRINNELPGLAVVVFSSDSIYDMIFSGFKKLGSEDPLSSKNRFHLGSNTKAFVGFAAASMVEDGLIEWDSKYFDICPENKELAKPEYHDITLDQLLRHQAGLISKNKEFTEYTMANMGNDSVIGKNIFIRWSLSFDKFYNGFQYSNTGYVMAAQMLERQSGKSWKEIIRNTIFDPLSIDGYFGWPAKTDTNQTWGHYTDPLTGKYIPHDPKDLYYLSRLNLDPAGDLNISATNYIRFLQDNLKGYNGTGGILSDESYKLMHDDPEYGLGWRYTKTVYKANNVSIHSGSAGTFFCQSFLFKDDDLGIVIFSNCNPGNSKEIVQTLTNDLLDDFMK